MTSKKKKKHTHRAHFFESDNNFQSGKKEFPLHCFYPPLGKKIREHNNNNFNRWQLKNRKVKKDKNIHILSKIIGYF